MRIGIVLHPYDEKRPSGLGRYNLELVTNLLKEDQGNEYIIFLKKQPAVLPIFSGKNWSIVCGNGGLFWLDHVLKKIERADVYVFTTPIMPLFFSPHRSIVVALDFAYKKLKAPNVTQWIKNQLLFLYQTFSLKRASRIVATCEATKTDLVRLFSIDKGKISIIYPGFTRLCDLPEKTFPVPEKYFFYIGAIKERKNVMNVVKGFIQFKEKSGNEHKLLIAGNNSGSYYEKIVAYIKSKKRETDIVFLGYVSDEKAAYLHKHAEAFVFVTLIEGSFGMPVLEAMDCGAPVMTSDSDTTIELKETESALVVDPYNVNDIDKGFIRIASDKILRDKLRFNGKKFSSHISWKKMANEMITLATSLAS